MVLPLISNLDKNYLSKMLTDLNAQARNVSFNIQFNNLQNTTLDRMNKEIEKVADIQGNQRELDALNKSIVDLSARREKVITFAYANESNGDHFVDIINHVTNALAEFSLGDMDVENLSANEKTAYEKKLSDIVASTKFLVELSHPDFVDGNNVTHLRAQVEELSELSATVGVIDDEGVLPASNDNRKIVDLLGDIAATAGASNDSSTTLQHLARKTVQDIDRKLAEIDTERRELSVFRAGEIEFEIQMLKTKYANFLRTVELSFDTQSQNLTSITNAMKIDEDPELGSIVSIFT